TYRTYCHPRFYEGLPNALYRNNGDGTFSNVSGPSGIGSHVGKGMGVAFADYDEDGDLDVFVTNDTVPNFLFRNEGGQTFREVALEAGVGYNDDGRTISSMGVDFRDVDNDGREDLFITALSNETFPLFRNLGKGLFADVTYPSRLGALSLPLSGWGTGIYDFDNDGWKDIFTANGDVQDNTELFSSRKSRLASTIFLNLANGKFELVELGKAGLHRGAAFGDFDGDGRVDVVVSRIQDEAAILLNRSGEGNHWLAFRLRGTRSNRDGIGAKVKVSTASGTQWNMCTTSVGYASSSDRTVHFGLGKDDVVKEVEIRWPSGVVQRLTNVSVDRYVNVTEPEQ
ncbi:MAG: CRTAC1 family protein, partial [Bryobacteraceae bacterium]|nr:CRTAC1 family protein [Bryobacteraceae bacterium]